MGTGRGFLPIFRRHLGLERLLQRPCAGFRFVWDCVLDWPDHLRAQPRTHDKGLRPAGQRARPSRHASGFPQAQGRPATAAAVGGWPLRVSRLASRIGPYPAAYAGPRGEAFPVRWWPRCCYMASPARWRPARGLACLHTRLRHEGAASWLLTPSRESNWTAPGRQAKRRSALLGAVRALMWSVGPFSRQTDLAINSHLASAHAGLPGCTATRRQWQQACNDHGRCPAAPH